MAGREKVTYHLRRMSAEQAKDSDPDSEDMEDSKHFHNLASGNQTGTLTIKEAEEVLELFEEDNSVIVDTNGARWVEID